MTLGIEPQISRINADFRIPNPRRSAKYAVFFPSCRSCGPPSSRLCKKASRQGRKGDLLLNLCELRALGVRFLETRDDRGQGAAEAGGHDFHFRTDGHGVEKADDVARFHADAAIAGRPADAVFLGGAVNVDAASEGAGVLRFESAEMQDAGDDGIATGRVGTQDFAGPALPVEDGSHRGIATDFRRDLQHSERGGETAWAISDTEFGSGDAIFGGANSVFDHGEALVRDTYHDDWQTARGGRTDRQGDEHEQEKHG